MSVLTSPPPANGEFHNSLDKAMRDLESPLSIPKTSPDLQPPLPEDIGYTPNRIGRPLPSQERVRRNTEPSPRCDVVPVPTSSVNYDQNFEVTADLTSDGAKLLDKDNGIFVPAGILKTNNNLSGATGRLRSDSDAVKLPQREFVCSKAQSDAANPRDQVLKLPTDKFQQLVAAPDSLPQRTILSPTPVLGDGVLQGKQRSLAEAFSAAAPRQLHRDLSDRRQKILTIDTEHTSAQRPLVSTGRPAITPRALSTPTIVTSPHRQTRTDKSASHHIVGDEMIRHDIRPPARTRSSSDRPQLSPRPSSLPLPPLSIPTYLQLELSSQRPSQLYIHRSANADFPYESSKVKIERLLNFLFLPPQLESVLLFGTLICVDAWLYIFTILPLRLSKSLYILTKSLIMKILTEIQYVSQFIFYGAGRMWQRWSRSSAPNASPNLNGSATIPKDEDSLTPKSKSRQAKFHHRRNKSVPSTLLPDDKADLLKGLLIVCTTLILLRFDASRTYHWIRGQAVIKLYVIYNVLEVCDRLLSAIGQDVLECLFSRETLERKPDGHSKILRPFWLFILALAYTTAHATALFHQVITLNVAVNAYSNALITLLMSNQFVEIKSTVFKKFEKENLFQLTCADIVERFQLWHMLIIIASRNIVETGALNQGFQALAAAPTATASSNSSTPFSNIIPPLSATSILPRSFTMLPAVVNSITSYAPTVGHIMGPFFVVMGSEMFVDWLKHAYINKFNNVKPVIYARFLDVLAKDYYTHAFAEQNLTKRLGLPLIPLSCLLIRAGVQVYQMFMAAWVPSLLPTSSTSLASIHEQFSTARSTLPTSPAGMVSWTIDEFIHALPQAIVDSGIVSYFTTILVCLLVFLVLLTCKLVLGMILLSFSRARYRSMKERERNSTHYVEGGRRIGGWGVVEVDEDKRKLIYEDDANGLRALKDREERERMKREKEKDKSATSESYDHVQRYNMVAKRIW